MKHYKLTLLALMASVVFSCKKKDEPNDVVTSTSGKVGFEFSNYAGNTEIALNSGNYVNANGDTFKVSKFNYYISNIRMQKSDGSYYGFEGYHLIHEDLGSSKHFHLESVSTGTYKSISFVIGVDSIKNVTGAQTGDLDPALGMFWTWSTGYIMAKLEGTSPKSTATDKTFQYHIGGFSGANSGLRVVTLDLSANPMEVKTGKESSVAIKADVLKWFSPNVINIATTNSVMMVSTTSKQIADNYANMFSVMSVTNE
jgi:hypothetical protein